MKLTIRRSAEQSILAAARWYAREGGFRLRTRFVAAVLATTVAIRQAPARFPVVKTDRRFGDVRRAMLAVFPYSVYFFVRGEEIVIVHVRHQARRPLHG